MLYSELLTVLLHKSQINYTLLFYMSFQVPKTIQLSKQQIHSWALFRHAYELFFPPQYDPNAYGK
jgi:hypothetical protein